MDRFKASNKGEFFRVYINDLLHLAVLKSEIRGVQSWITLDEPTGFPYVIEFYMKKGQIKLEYDKIEKWEEILKLIDKLVKPT